MRMFLLGALIAGLIGFNLGYKEGLKEREAKPKPKNLAQIISVYSAKHKLPPKLVRAVIHVESRGNPRAVSKAGCLGLMQIHPKFHYCKNYFDPEENIAKGCQLLAGYKKKQGTIRKALAYYNAGKHMNYRYADKVLKLAEVK